MAGNSFTARFSGKYVLSQKSKFLWCSLILLQYLRGIVIQLEDQIHNGENTTVTNTYYQGCQI